MSALQSRKSFEVAYMEAPPVIHPWGGRQASCGCVPGLCCQGGSLVTWPVTVGRCPDMESTTCCRCSIAASTVPSLICYFSAKSQRGSGMHSPLHPIQSHSVQNLPLMSLGIGRLRHGTECQQVVSRLLWAAWAMLHLLYLLSLHCWLLAWVLWGQFKFQQILQRAPKQGVHARLHGTGSVATCGQRQGTQSRRQRSADYEASLRVPISPCLLGVHPAPLGLFPNYRPDHYLVRSWIALTTAAPLILLVTRSPCRYRARQQRMDQPRQSSNT